VGLRGDVASRTVWAQDVRDDGETPAEHLGQRALRAEVPRAGPQDLLPSIDRLGRQTRQAKSRASDDPVKTAIGV
jgi:hypothetical protein